MKNLFQSPVIAATIVSAGLVASALIVSRPAPSAIAAVEPIPSEQTLRTQFVAQVKSQLGNGSFDVMGTKRQVQDIVIDKFQMSPNRNRVDIDYHATWQDTDVCTYTQMSLIRDAYGRFDSGQVSGMFDNKSLKVIVQ